LDGAAEGAEAVRMIVGTIRELYEQQEFNFAGPSGDNSFLEVYTARVRGEPIGCVVLARSVGRVCYRLTLRSADLVPNQHPRIDIEVHTCANSRSRGMSVRDPISIRDKFAD
jgi:hypothetical protein